MYLSLRKGGSTLKIITSYSIPLTGQLSVTGKKRYRDACSSDKHAVSGRLMRCTSDVCLSALKLCCEIFMAEWDYLKALSSLKRKGIPNRSNEAEKMIHSTNGNTAKYPEFDKRFPNFPAYTRRSITSKALGMVSSYMANHKNWESQDTSTRGEEPTLGIPDGYSLTFYEQSRDMSRLDESVIGLQLYNGKTWEWYYFTAKPSDMRYIKALTKTRKMQSPTVEKVHGRYRIKFSFMEDKELVSDKNPLGYTIMAVDLGINAPASWAVMTSDGTVHGKGVIHLNTDESRLNHLMNRKRMCQQAGKKPRSIYRLVTDANRQLSIDTTRALMDIADLYSVDCIAFEYLDRPKHVSGKRYRERIHMWRANDVQKRVTLQAHRRGIRISRICAWGTSRYAYDGSGITDRHSVYTYIHGKKKYNYSVCTFPNKRIYNCDLSAAQNIDARYFLREYQKLYGCELPVTPKRTYADLINMVSKLPKTA